MSDDAWSYVFEFLCADAWESALAIASIHRTCQAWRSLPLWNHWTKAFCIFPFPANRVPASLVPIMRSATERRGCVNQKSAMDLLKIKAASLKGLAHKTANLGLGRKMYLYNLGDILRAATATYASVANFEQRLQQVERQKLQRARNREAKRHRAELVEAMLQSMDARFIDARDVKEFRDYIDKNRGTLETLRPIAVEMKNAHDAEEARRTQYRLWMKERRLSEWMYRDLSVVRRFIDEGVGTKDDVVRAVMREFRSNKERVLARQKQAPARRVELAAELAAHGLDLRSDSTFCRDYIRGETDASLQEVVATMKLTSFLFSKGHRAWSMWHKILEKAMKKRMLAGQAQCWYAACE